MRVEFIFHAVTYTDAVDRVVALESTGIDVVVRLPTLSPTVATAAEVSVFAVTVNDEIRLEALINLSTVVKALTSSERPSILAFKPANPSNINQTNSQPVNIVIQTNKDHTLCTLYHALSIFRIIVLTGRRRFSKQINLSVCTIDT